MDIAWKLLDQLPMPWQTVAILVAMGVIGMIGVSKMIAKLRGPEGQAHMERVIRETADELRSDVREVGNALSDFKVETANHFGKLDERMVSFERSLHDHDERGKELRKDVKEAINSKIRMI